jgi:hypothetical protein
VSYLKPIPFDPSSLIQDLDLLLLKRYRNPEFKLSEVILIGMDRKKERNNLWFFGKYHPRIPG